MPRGFHPSPQLFRIPEDTDAADEEPLFSPIVWVAILRDACMLVDIGEEDVPDVVVETAQGLLWEQSDNETDSWVEYSPSNEYDDDDLAAYIWKGLRYNERPWSFACVYNSQRLSLSECQRWMMEQVRWTASVRTVDPVWLHGEYHACQTLFAPLLQERLQAAGGVPDGDSIEEECDLESPTNNMLGVSKELYGETQGGESSGDWVALEDRDFNTSMASRGQDERGVNKGTDHVQGENRNPYPTSPPRQPRSPTKGSPTRSPYKEQTTEELVQRLARKQAELDRQRQEEREKRGSPVKGRGVAAEIDRSAPTARNTIKPVVDNTHDVDSGSLTSATADDDEEEYASSMLDDRHEESKPWKCWFLPSLPHSKEGALAP